MVLKIWPILDIRIICRSQLLEVRKQSPILSEQSPHFVLTGLQSSLSILEDRRLVVVAFQLQTQILHELYI